MSALSVLLVRIMESQLTRNILRRTALKNVGLCKSSVHAPVLMTDSFPSRSLRNQLRRTKAMERAQVEPSTFFNPQFGNLRCVHDIDDGGYQMLEGIRLYKPFPNRLFLYFRIRRPFERYVV